MASITSEVPTTQPVRVVFGGIDTHKDSHVCGAGGRRRRAGGAVPRLLLPGRVIGSCRPGCAGPARWGKQGSIVGRAQARSRWSPARGMTLTAPSTTQSKMEEPALDKREARRFLSPSQDGLPLTEPGQLARHNAYQLGSSDDHLGDLSAGQGAHHRLFSKGSGTQLILTDARRDLQPATYFALDLHHTGD
jgi:hypothetical protein